MRCAVTRGVVWARGGLSHRKHRTHRRGRGPAATWGVPPKNRAGRKVQWLVSPYYFTSGLETLAMMLDYVEFTGDKKSGDCVMVLFAPRGAALLRRSTIPAAQMADSVWNRPRYWRPSGSRSTRRRMWPDCGSALDGLLTMKAGTYGGPVALAHVIRRNPGGPAP